MCTRSDGRDNNRDREARTLAALFERLRVGSSLIKIAAGGSAVKKHVYVTPGNSHLKWDPSRRKADSDFVDIASIKHLLAGPAGARVLRYTSSSEQASVRKFLDLRSERAYESTSGWLEKLGGAHGGRKNWQRRWCVLLGTELFYFANPADPDEKGHMNVAGSVVTPHDDGLSFVVSWTDGETEQPTREFKAESAAERDRWITALKRIVRLDRARQGKTRPDSKLAAAMGKSGGAAAGSLVSDDSLKARAKEFASMGPPDVADMSFTVATSADDDRGVSFICPSLREYDVWYMGLLAAIAQRRNLAPEKRIQEYTSLLAEHENDALLRVALGEQYEATGDLDAALNEYQQAAELQPRLPSVRKACGRLLLRHGDNAPEAVRHLEAAAVLLEGDDFDTFMLLGEARMAIRQYVPAAAAYQQASVIEPTYISAHVGAGDAFAAAEDATAAEAAYASAVMLLRKAVAAGRPAESGSGKAQMDEDLLRKHAAALTACGRAADAARALKEAEDVEVAHAPQHFARATAASEPGHWRESIRHWEIVLRANPEDVTTLLGAATAYYEAEGDRRNSAAPSTTPAGAAAATVSTARGAAGVAASAPSSRKPSAANTKRAAAAADDDGDAEDESNAEGDAGSDDDPANGLGGIVGVEDSGPKRRASVAISRVSRASSLRVDISLATEPTSVTVPAGAPPFGSLPADKMTCKELLTRAEELVVRVLSLDAANAGANVLCAKVFERLADVERAELQVMMTAGGFAGPDGEWQAVDTSIPLDDQMASSGWTPSARLQRVEAFLQYVAAAYTEAKYSEAPYLLGRLYRRLSRNEEAVAQLQLAVERDPANMTAADLLVRVKRVISGKPEEEESPTPATSSRRGSKAGKSKKADDDGFGHELEISRATSGTKDERDAAFFAAMKEKKKKEEEEKKKREEDKLRSMTAEEREQHESAMRDKEKHDARKERMLKGQLGAYSGASARANLLGRGGRGGRSGRGVGDQ